MQFQLTLTLSNDAMQTPTDVAYALNRAASCLQDYAADWSEFPDGLSLFDANGNHVGQWALLDYEPRPLVPDHVLREIIEDLGCDWLWVNDLEFGFDAILPEGDPDGIILTVGYWDDGEEHGVPTPDNDERYTSAPITRRQLTDALYDMAEGKVTPSPYQIAAASDFILNPEEADGDADTADMLVQWAIFGEVMFS